MKLEYTTKYKHKRRDRLYTTKSLTPAHKRLRKDMEGTLGFAWWLFENITITFGG